jgi:hypothetical protein
MGHTMMSDGAGVGKCTFLLYYGRMYIDLWRLILILEIYTILIILSPPSPSKTLFSFFSCV